MESLWEFSEEERLEKIGRWAETQGLIVDPFVQRGYGSTYLRLGPPSGKHVYASHGGWAETTLFSVGIRVSDHRRMSRHPPRHAIEVSVNICPWPGAQWDADTKKEILLLLEEEREVFEEENL